MADEFWEVFGVSLEDGMVAVFAFDLWVDFANSMTRRPSLNTDVHWADDPRVMGFVLADDKGVQVY